MKWRFGALTIVVCLGLVITFGAVLYLTHFYYRQKPYILGVRNVSDVVIWKTNLRLEPEGEHDCGVLDPGQGKFHMDPPWPVPQSITVTFEEEGGAKHSLFTPTGLSKDFRGKIIILISRTNNQFLASVEQQKGGK